MPTFASNFEDSFQRFRQVSAENYVVLTLDQLGHLYLGDRVVVVGSQTTVQNNCFFSFYIEKRNFVEMAKSSKGHFAKQKYT